MPCRYVSCLARGQWGGAGRCELPNHHTPAFLPHFPPFSNHTPHSTPYQDFEASADLFLASRDEEDALLARANAALTYYELGYEESALKLMNDVIRRQPGFTDMRVALAAHAWGEGNLGAAEKEWRFACENTSTGCAVYRDLDYVQRIRRWPPTLVTKLGGFLGKSKVVSEGGSSVSR